MGVLTPNGVMEAGRGWAGGRNLLGVSMATAVDRVKAVERVERWMRGVLFLIPPLCAQGRAMARWKGGP